LWTELHNELSHQAWSQIEYYATITVVKMSINLDSNPPPDLSGRRLDAATKRKLVAETHADGSNYFTVMEKYNLKHSTLRGYYKRVKRELPIFKSNGRPSKVDSIGREVVLNFLTENPTTEKADIYPVVREQMKATLLRMYPNGIPATVSSGIAKSSVRRWAQHLIDEHSSMTTEPVTTEAVNSR
jgi:hypothetical protein